MGVSVPDRELAAFRRRLEAMGLEGREAPGGQSLLVRLPVSGTPLHAGGWSVPLRHIVFSTVGANRIKCLFPRPLFHLPLIPVADCESPGAIEARIRQAWAKRQEQLGRARQWLEKLGCRSEMPHGAPVLHVDLGLGHPETRLVAIEPGALVMPGAGPLEGVALQRAPDRVFRPSLDIDSATDLGLAVTARMEELARLDARLVREARVRAALQPAPEERVARRRYAILLVGRRLLGDSGLIESLRLRGYRVTAVRGGAEALRAFETRSFELALVESDLDRFEGIEMVPTLRALPGVEEVPIVIVDTRVRPELRETARRIGAAGYVTHPIDVPLVEDGLARLLGKPRRRRFRRHGLQLGVRAAGTGGPEVARQIGRGGMLVASERELSAGTLQRFALALPDNKGPLRVDAEVVYRLRGGDGWRSLLGLRFDGFPDNDEERLIAWLTALEEEP